MKLSTKLLIFRQNNYEKNFENVSKDDKSKILVCKLAIALRYEHHNHFNKF